MREFDDGRTPRTNVNSRRPTYQCITRRIQLNSLLIFYLNSTTSKHQTSLVDPNQSKSDDVSQPPKRTNPTTTTNYSTNSNTDSIWQEYIFALNALDICTDETRPCSSLARPVRSPKTRTAFSQVKDDRLYRPHKDRAMRQGVKDRRNIILALCSILFERVYYRRS